MIEVEVEITLLRDAAKALDRVAGDLRDCKDRFDLVLATARERQDAPVIAAVEEMLTGCTADRYRADARRCEELAAAWEALMGQAATSPRELPAPGRHPQGAG